MPEVPNPFYWAEIKVVTRPFSLCRLKRGIYSHFLPGFSGCQYSFPFSSPGTPTTHLLTFYRVSHTSLRLCIILLFFFPFVSQTRKSQLTYLQFSHCFFCHFKSATELLTWLFVISVVTFQLQIFGLFFIISISSQIFSTWWKTTPILYFSSLNIVSFNTLNIFLTADLKSA